MTHDSKFNSAGIVSKHAANGLVSGEGIDFVPRSQISRFNRPIGNIAWLAAAYARG